MTWRNIFDLGAVELYWSDSVSGALMLIEDLPSGSIEVVNGVIQCRGLPENVNNGGVGTIIAIPAGPFSASVPARMTISNISVPRLFMVSDLAFIAGVCAPTESPPVEVVLTPTIEADVVVNLTPNTNVALGDLSEGLPALKYAYSESVA